tara:strand:- start:168084 stop:168668 length:585 start_codon:yes stop_codon:yes gene_type:complete
MRIHRHRAAGFSLLELLLVLFVVVLVTSMVTLNVGSGSRDLELESRLRSLSEVAAYALDEAQVTGRDYALQLREQELDGRPVVTFSWWMRSDELGEADTWESPPPVQDVFAEQSLPQEVEVQLSLDEGPLIDLTPALEARAVPQPQLVLYASGETTPGVLDVRQRDTGQLLWRVEWDLLGRFSLLPRGEALEPL